MSGDTDDGALKAFVAYWQNVQGGAERANYQIFVSQLCDVLDLPKPGAATGGVLGDYQFEGPVPGGSLRGGPGFIDLYKRGCFILEAKQSKLSAPEKLHPELFDAPATAPATPAGAKYDRLMRDARRQAEHYAHTLPASHASVPFVIVCDVGRTFELYFDYAGNGRGYAFFPDKQRYRIALADLLSDATIPGTDHTAAALLRAIWIDPASVDPRTRSAGVTRDVARKLAQVSLHLEEEGRRELKKRGLADPAHEAEMVEGTALFLMRILFCMFAEDVGLLPEGRFTEFLKSCARPYNPDDPGDLIDEQTLRNGLVSLWQAMDTPDEGGRYAFAMREQVRYFNGGLFGRRDFFRLARNDLDSLIDAARHRWTNVEPAIFGTLLEQALSPADRAKLGAHYTPRPYVERLVQATISDVLVPEWTAAQDAIRAAQEAGDGAEALAKAKEFLTTLQGQRVLDPACGTGNFLYVAMETLLRLESDVIETIASLGGEAVPALGPANFLGLELNPRAAVIAELVLWIGWLRWRTANDPAAVPDPVLRRTNAINFGSTHGYDAVLARDEAGEVVQPPRQSEWPEAEFIVGNPPFIGKGQKQRQTLGSAYVAAMRVANEFVPSSGNFFLQWWDRSARAVATSSGVTRRAGLVTSNTISQPLNRKVLEKHLNSKDHPVSIVFAISDHPWEVRGKDGADVRIAMSVLEAGERHPGVLLQVVREEVDVLGESKIEYQPTFGLVDAKLTQGSLVTSAKPLKANDLSSNGVLLAGRGFVISAAEKSMMAIAQGSAAPFRPYVAGSELMKVPKNRYVIDFSGLDESEARAAGWAAYQHLLSTVKVAREKVIQGETANDAVSYANNWWRFAKERRSFREAASGVKRFIATTETTKFRVFQFLPSNVLFDHMIVGIASDQAWHLGILSSAIHRAWTYANSGMMGVATISQGHRYTKSEIFDRFPFPDPSEQKRLKVAELGEELDATRKAALAEHPRLTMTGLYNLVEKLRAGAALTPAEERDARDGRARIVLHLHEQLDAAVAAAYGWEWPLAPAEIVARLVALNRERAAEEAAGHIRWLRPDYQIPRFGQARGGGPATH